MKVTRFDILLKTILYVCILHGESKLHKTIHHTFARKVHTVTLLRINKITAMSQQCQNSDLNYPISNSQPTSSPLPPCH